jgi:hypothetical protein
MGSERIVVQAVRMTCSACPSQWEGNTADNRAVYVRYRWGHLTVSVSKPGADMDAAVMGEVVFAGQLGDGMDGFLSFDELRHATPDIQWPDHD